MELSVSEESNDMKISVLHTHGPSASYMPDTLWLPQTAILATAKTATGCTYTLPVKRPN
jgi:hypothetical protein